MLVLGAALAQQYGREMLVLGAIALAVWLIVKYIVSQRETPHSAPTPAYDASQGARRGGHEATLEAPSPGALRIAVSGQGLAGGFRPAPRPAGLETVASFRRPALARQDGDAFWLPLGTEAHVAGYRLAGGLLYVGAALGAVSDTSIVEPALIDPRLPVGYGSNADYRTRLLPYWPSYSAASPEARGAYLRWLSGGRADPAADLGYVFLYFYGLERRALADTQTSRTAATELPAIEREVERLLSLYGSHSSFSRYAGSFLDYLRTSNDTAPPAADPPPVRDGCGLAFAHRLALGQFAAAGKPLPAPWALAWMKADPMTRLRTPAQRCPDEFTRLFVERYGEEYGEGMKLPVNKTRLTVSHYPASGSFSGRTLQKSFDLPDVAVLTSPVKKLQALAEVCMAELDGYSRVIGRSPDKKGSLDAFLELPVRLWPEANRRQLEQTRDTITKAGRPAAIKFEKLRSWLPDWREVTKTRVSAFATRLAEAGLGMEPDPRFGGAVPDADSTVVLFSDDGKLTSSSARYSAAALTLHLGAAVSGADGEVGSAERTLLLSQMESWLHLDEAERRRLRAHARWLLAEPPGLNGIKKRVEGLAAPAREAIGDFLTQVAQADNEVTPAEVKMLERIFKTLALDTKLLYSKLHMAATEPVTVQPGAPAAAYSIPPAPPKKKTAGLGIDMTRVAALQAESERVTVILSAIFAAEQAPVEPQPAADAPEPLAEQAVFLVMGLDAAHSDFLQLLCTRSEWTRTELEELAADRGMMLDGALAHLNEAAYDRYDQPLSEGDDPVELNPDVVKEILK